MSVTEEPHEIVNSLERQVTHQAIDSFLESARMTTDSKNETDHVGKVRIFLNAFITVFM